MMVDPPRDGFSCTDLKIVELLARHRAASDLKRPVERRRISLKAWTAEMKLPMEVRFVLAERRALEVNNAARAVQPVWASCAGEGASLLLSDLTDCAARTDRRVPEVRAARYGFKAWMNRARQAGLVAEATCWEASTFAIPAIGAAFTRRRASDAAMGVRVRCIRGGMSFG
jgi:hypothetical protein